LKFKSRAASGTGGSLIMRSVSSDPSEQGPKEALQNSLRGVWATVSAVHSLVSFLSWRVALRGLPTAIEWNAENAPLLVTLTIVSVLIGAVLVFAGGSWIGWQVGEWIGRTMAPRRWHFLLLGAISVAVGLLVGLQSHSIQFGLGYGALVCLFAARPETPKGS
jgi:hypothetical protein